MKQADNVFRRLESKQDIAYSLIRIYLGVALCVRGALLFSDPSAIAVLGGVDGVYMWYSYIVGAHLIGGFLLALGFLTRFFVFLQLPILAGAVFFFHLEQGLMTVGQSLELATLVMVLLFIYFLFGAGKLSLDHYIADKKSRASDFDKTAKPLFNEQSGE